MSIRIVGIFLTLPLALPTPAFADGKSDAAALVNKGNQQFVKRDFRAAQALYEAAYRAYPSAKLFYNLAEVHRELGHPAKAADYLERFLLESSVSDSAPLRRAAERRRAELSKSVAVISIRSSNTGAEVHLNGEHLGTLPIRRLHVPPGPHELVIRQNGFVAQTESMTLKAGERRTIDVQLSLVRPPAMPRLPAVTRAPDRPSVIAATTEPASLTATNQGSEPSITEKWWFWTLVIGGAAVAAGATALIVDATQYNPSSTLGRSTTDDWDR